MKGQGPGASIRQSGVRAWRDLPLGRDEGPLDDESARVNGYRVLSGDNIVTIAVRLFDTTEDHD